MYVFFSEFLDGNGADSTSKIEITGDIRQLFDSLDQDRNGALSREEILRLLEYLLCVSFDLANHSQNDANLTGILYIFWYARICMADDNDDYLD